MATVKKETTIKKEVTKKPVKAETVILASAGRAGGAVEGSIKIKTDSSPKAQNDKKTTKAASLSVAMFSLLGKEAGSLDLPKSLFGAEVNQALLSQALRVYMNNQKGHHSNTKTRGEVEGSTRKIYAQKGTGRARHGGVRAPIFVGGGRALGPKYRKTILDLPKKMKQAALISALSRKHLDKEVFGISGLDKATGKTSEIAKLMKGLGKKTVLIVAEKGNNLAQRAAQNIKGTSFIAAEEINTFEVIKSHSLIFTKGAVDALEKRVLKLESNASEAAKESKTQKKETTRLSKGDK